MSDFEAILRAYEAAGGNPELLKSPKVASLVISGNQVLGANDVAGLEVIPEPLPDGVRIKVFVEPGAVIENPVHMCFGVIPKEGVQRILSTYEIGAGASAHFLAHCTFPNAVRVEHIMDSSVHVGCGATMRYNETHYHGEAGGVQVRPTAHIEIDEGGRYHSDFSQAKGRVGKMELDYVVDVAANGLAELTAKALGYGDDEIIVKETIRLNGRGSRGLAKSRVAVRDRARSDVYATTEGHAPQARGHVDCVEIVRDRAIANAVPVVRVTNDQAQVTHEAAIGTVGKKELETIMSRGVDEDAAVDVIVRGMLAG